MQVSPTDSTVTDSTKETPASDTLPATSPMTSGKKKGSVAEKTAAEEKEASLADETVARLGADTDGNELHQINGKFLRPPPGTPLATDNRSTENVSSSPESTSKNRPKRTKEGTKSPNRYGFSNEAEDHQSKKQKTTGD